MIRELVPRAQGVGHHEVHRGPEEGKVVVAAVPDQHVAFAGGSLEDRGVVDTGVHHRPPREVRFVLLAFLDRRVGAVEVLVGSEPLHALGGEIAVGHGMSDDDRSLPRGGERVDDPSRRLALAGPRPHGAHGHHRDRRVEHRRVRPEQREVGPGRQDLARAVHHVLVRHVRVREHDLVDA